MSSRAFDQKKYWIDRHEGFRGDPRSVGTIHLSLEQNREAERWIRSSVGAVATYLKNGSQESGFVLDLGCGYGRVATELIDRGFERYLGIDVSPHAIEEARARELRGRFEVADLQNFDNEVLLKWDRFGTKQFDLVCALYVFAHFVDSEQWRSMVTRALSAVGPRGAILIADMMPAETIATDVHVVHRSWKEYESVLSSLGDREFSIDQEFRKHIPGSSWDYTLLRRIR